MYLLSPETRTCDPRYRNDAFTLRTAGSSKIGDSVPNSRLGICFAVGSVSPRSGLAHVLRKHTYLRAAQR